MTNRSVLITEKKKILHNLDYFRSLFKPATKVMVMVKAFGYGVGNPELSKILEENEVDYLGVAFTSEGVALRKAGVKIPIMVMNPHPDQFDDLLKYGLEPEIYSLNVLEKLNEILIRKSIHCPIHIKVETGMNRLGFDQVDLSKMINIIRQNNRIQVAGILTHLSSAEIKEEEDFTLRQIKIFQDISDQLSQELNINPLRHILNSAGAVNFPEFHFDMVRLGIGIFGIDRSYNSKSPIKNACILKTVISQIKTLQEGDSVGYGRAGKVEKNNTQIATVAMGYADGFYRSLGNGNGQVWVNGNWARTIGNICMDMFMIDVTGLQVQEGDEVEIFGNNQSIESLAKAANTIPYEVFTSIGERVERIFL